MKLSKTIVRLSGLCVSLTAAYAYAGTAYTTQPASNITTNSVTLNGYAASTLGLSGEFFQLGLTSNYGSNYLASPQGVNGPVSANVSGLNCNTTYHFRFIGDPKPPQTTLQGEDMSFTTAPCSIPPTLGFTGSFAPNLWTQGQNPQANLINLSNVPQSITLTNYSAWYSSGVVMLYQQNHAAGTVSFNYTSNNTSTICPATYSVNGTQIKLTTQTGNVSFKVAANASFGFALNGENLPNDFACKSPGQLVSYTISNFVFTPD